MAFDIQFWKQCCSVKHDWMNFNYVSFESILIILHEINMIIVTHPTTSVHCFRVLFFSGTHCKGVSKQLCVYHLYRNVFLAQTRIRSHLGCIFLFRNSFQYPQSNRDSKRVSKRLSRVVAFIIDFSVSRVRVTRKACHCGAALRNFIRNTMHLKAFQNSFAFITFTEACFWLKRVSDHPFFSRFRKAFLTP